MLDITWENLPDVVRAGINRYRCEAQAVMWMNPNPNAWVIKTAEYGSLRLGVPQRPLNKLFKSAAEPPFSAPARLFANAQAALGGPNPIAASLVASALTASAGGLGGFLIQKLLPDYLDEDLYKRTALAGGALGAGGMLAMYGGPQMAAIDKETGQPRGWKGLLDPGPWSLNPPEPTPPPPLPAPGAQPPQGWGDWFHGLFKDPTGPSMPPKAPVPAPAKHLKHSTVTDQALSMPIDALIADLEDRFGYRWTADEQYLKTAEFAGSILRPFPADEFGQLIEADPYLTTPQAAIARGLPLATAAATGSNWVTPYDIARVSIGAGLGSALGRGLGMVAGPILGLTPKARDGLQNVGLIAGIVKSVLGLYN